jgi:hypothetical protein
MFAVVTRLPFLDAGYGIDPDALRLVNAARAIADSGVYKASRLPGYPVQEYLVAGLLPGGVWAVKAVTAWMSWLSGVFFALSLRAFGNKDSWLLAAALLSVPVVYINSVCAMDYVWALAFGMPAAFLAIQQRPVLAGVCVGLAIGTRITSGAMLLPVALLLAAKSPSWARTWRASLKLGVVSIGVGAACLRRYSCAMEPSSSATQTRAAAARVQRSGDARRWACGVRLGASRSRGRCAPSLCHQAGARATARQATRFSHGRLCECRCALRHRVPQTPA